MQELNESKVKYSCLKYNKEPHTQHWSDMNWHSENCLMMNPKL